ncbi:23S rRNA (guanosine(2251)-2'-O)-methyltransferase RlmB [Sessilibacter corallicola]|uniref:23S rRNA (guanosine(2251)-2'-O)-methyltransferase RlmB n=1 Tax=Sessilibacter corallicola TaxID=2904075 RepID=UPI001E56F48F|nr:23S rRNA (guanosine(2251)-2'-O)-methyltransferase RlmB [Sessilibacter corallicola]MCE2030308.1 23S rRNA (guanosine(2251)-2'-O)-methyltransferase RlmB [Sessilibacter corallicola]
MAKLESVYGLHAVHSLLKSSPYRVVELKVLKDRSDRRLQQILSLAEQNGISVQSLKRASLDKIADGNHQGVVAMATPGESYTESYLDTLLATASAENTNLLFLVLDGVTDPHNLGACLRSAEAAGAAAVIAPKDNSASLNTVARKVSSGASDSIPYITVTNLSRSLKTMQEQGVWVVGAAGEAENSLYSLDLTGAIALVMGAEGKGLRRLTRETCDHLAKLPMAGEVSSLNVSVAAGVFLYEAVRQRVKGR